jgi:hypothetical protein
MEEAALKPSSSHTVTTPAPMGRAHTAAPVTTCRRTAGTRWTCAGRSATCRGPRRHTRVLWKRTEACNHVNVSCSDQNV